MRPGSRYLSYKAVGNAGVTLLVLLKRCCDAKPHCKPTQHGLLRITSGARNEGNMSSRLRLSMRRRGEKRCRWHKLNFREAPPVPREKEWGVTSAYGVPTVGLVHLDKQRSRQEDTTTYPAPSLPILLQVGGTLIQKHEHNTCRHHRGHAAHRAARSGSSTVDTRRTAGTATGRPSRSGQSTHGVRQYRAREPYAKL